jgi:hypothetical protein
MPQNPTNRSIKRSIKSFIVRQSPTLLRDLWDIYHQERYCKELFERQTVAFNPERVSKATLKRDFLLITALLSQYIGV